MKADLALGTGWIEYFVFRANFYRYERAHTVRRSLAATTRPAKHCCCSYLNHTNAFLKTHRFHLMKTEQKICIQTSVFASFSLRFHPSTLMRFWKRSSKREQDIFVTSAKTMVTFVFCWTAWVLVTWLIIRHFVTKFIDSRLVFYYTWKRCSLLL